MARKAIKKKGPGNTGTPRKYPKPVEIDFTLAIESTEPEIDFAAALAKH